ncbi:GDSL lipase/acylhydrolase [Crepidotus variabilis]|uniref:GDSL lipase/acylhydrolase n=1 Tax=Crepidotus variabilis TaxID=179855 RepID=A0A9P6EHI8_9AGAR|nr:GDSL lipase/acylhydrolase [Crepidotus variabilis]
MVSSKVFLQLLSVALFAFSPAAAQGNNTSSGSKGLKPGQIKNLVTFGDSFTDTVEVHNGGTQWPVYVAGYANVSLHPYARSGAACSNNLTTLPQAFPSLFENELPTYYNDTASATGKLDPAKTLYTLWIGTNDLGDNALLTGTSKELGTSKASLVDVTKCIVNWVQDLYNHGARNFLFQNIINLEKVPLYATDSWPNRYWNAQRNTTEWSVFMRELTLSANALTSLQLQALAPTLQGAHIGIFDSHSLFVDMYNNPKNYLNGTAPLNVDGAVSICVYQLNGDQSNCTEVEGTDRDSYLWFDELHPSEQADRIVAREVAQVTKGVTNQWTTWLS